MNNLKKYYTNNDVYYQKMIAEFSDRMNVFDDGHASERVVQWMLKKLEEN